MAICTHYDHVQQTVWQAWIITQPFMVRRLAQVYPHDRRYQHKTTGHRVMIQTYQPDGKLGVVVDSYFNRDQKEIPPGVVLIVSDVNPAYLTECDLPPGCSARWLTLDGDYFVPEAF